MGSDRPSVASPVTTEQARECPVCRAVDSEEHLTIGDCTLLHCRGCKLVFSTEEPHEHQLPELYGRGYFKESPVGYRDYIAEESAHRRQARRYLVRLQQWSQPPGKLLDVGCAAGFFLDESRRVGWDVQGCEVSGFAADHAVALGLPVTTGPFLSANIAEDVWDVITLFNVFEHLAQPTEVVRKLHHLLAPGGVVVIETWNVRSWTARLFGASWHQYQPSHVPYYYSPPSLRALFDEADWQFLSTRISVKWISLGRGLDILDGRMGRWLPHLSGPLRRRAGRLELPYLADDLMTVAVQSQPTQNDVTPTYD